MAAKTRSRAYSVSEEYVKRSGRSAKSSFWIVTTDMDLSAEAAREAAHLQVVDRKRGLQDAVSSGLRQNEWSAMIQSQRRIFSIASPQPLSFSRSFAFVLNKKGARCQVYQNARMTGKGWLISFLKRCGECLCFDNNRNDRTPSPRCTIFSYSYRSQFLHVCLRTCSACTP